MTKLFHLLALATLCFAGLTARANDNQLVSKALSDASIKACVQAAKEPGFDIVGQVTDTTGTAGFCLSTEKSYRVDFFKVLRCNEAGNNGPCPKPAAVLVASAEFGCGGELTAAICY